MIPARLLRLVLPAVTVLLLATVIGWWPARSAASRAESRADSARRLVDELAWELEDLDDVVESVDELRDEAARHDEAIPPTHDLAGLILDLESLSGEVGVELVDIVPTTVLGSFDDPATPAGTSSVIVAVALTGEFGSTIRFLDGLSHLPRLVVTEAVAVGFDEASDTLAVDLELRIFTTEELVEFTDEFLDDFADEESDAEVAP